MNDIIASVIGKLHDAGIHSVHTLFDGEPISSKGDFFTLVGLKSFEALSPVYSCCTIYVPIRAELELTVAAPENRSLAELCAYYEDEIRPVICAVPELNCRPGTITCKPDRNIGRLTLTAALRVEGVRKIEREAEND